MSFSRLVESLNNTCCLTLHCKINRFLQYHLNCRTVFMVHVAVKYNEGIIFVIGENILQEEHKFKIKDYNGNQSDAQAATDHEIENILKLLIVPNPKNLLEVPINHPDREGLVCMIVYVVDPVYEGANNEQKYTKFILKCLSSCSAILINAFKVREQKKLKLLQERLLFIGRNYLFKFGDYNELLREIMFEARLVINAERCSLFLLSEDGSELVAKIFDGLIEEQAQEIRVPSRYGIIGYVAQTGVTLNVHNVQDHPLFYKRIEEAVGFKTRNVLCFPVRDDVSQVVGVAEFCNKRNGLNFDSFDEEAADTFSIYVSVVLMHSIVHKKMYMIRAHDRLSSEIVSYHVTSRDSDYETVLKCEEEHAFDVMLDFRWISRAVIFPDSVCYVLQMFEELGFMKQWRIPRETLLSFVLAVRRSYRDLPYHNWSHAFSVAHFAYLLIKKLFLFETCTITELEGLAFLVSALCHDMDHRGTTNSFQIITENNLARLYSLDGSVMERHHYSQTLFLINSENCNIFENLDAKQYMKVLGLIRDMIIATDLSQHLKCLPEERLMSVRGYSPGMKNHKTLLLSLLMTCSDLNDQLKGWSYCRVIAKNIYTEFFQQGDMEREMGKIPINMMDRESAFIPELQQDFLRSICIPCYSVLVNIFPWSDYYLDSLEDTCKCWERAIQWYREKDIPPKLSLDFITDPDLESFVFEQSS